MDTTKVAAFVERSTQTINEQNAQLQKYASAHGEAVKLIDNAVAAAHNAGFIGKDDMKKAAEAFADHALSLAFITNIANHLAAQPASLGTPTGETKTASAPVVDEAELALADRLGKREAYLAALATG